MTRFAFRNLVKLQALLCATALCATGLCAAAGAQSLTPIHNIMTNLPNSPLLGQKVSVSGVVVGIGSTGFYVTAPDAAWDSNQATAEGIDILAAGPAVGGASFTACAVVGDLVTVTGVVANETFNVNGANTPGTYIQPTACTVTGTGAVNGTITLASATSFGQDLVYTGMPVGNTTFNAISPTTGSTDPTTRIVTSTGQFYVDLATPVNGHLFKSAGLEADNNYPPPPAPAKGSSPGIPVWAGNPQRLLVDSTSFGGQAIDIGAGQVLTCKAGAGLTVGPTKGIGVIDYSYGFNTLRLFKTTTCTVSGSIAPSITSPADSAHFHVGTLNLNSFQGPATAAYATRLAKSALAIVNIFGKPDILSVQEVEDLSTLQAIGDAASALAGPGTTYQAYWAPSNDTASLALGFLVNTATVAVNKVYQVDVTDQFTQTSGAQVVLWERPPFVLEAGLLRAGQNYQVEVVNIETTSRDGIDGPSGPDIWERRGQQAEELSVFANAEQNRGQNLLIAGEYNAYSFSDGFVDIVDIVLGGKVPTPGTVAQYEPTVTSPAMYNFVNSITVPNSTYNVIEQGNARSIEHILCSETQNTSASGSIYSYISFVTQPHWTTDFPATMANDPTTASGLTPRDGFVGAFLIPPVPTTASLTPTSLNLGNQYRGYSSTTVLQFTNTSTFPSNVNVASITIAGANAGDFSFQSSCAGVSQGAACNIVVAFTPTNIGTRTASLTVKSDAGAEPALTVSLTGTGLDTTAFLTPAAAIFPATQLSATSLTTTFAFTNTGPFAETVSSAATTGEFLVTGSTCGTVAANASCTIAVAFRPTAAGNRTGTLTVLNTSTGNAMLTATLSGTGLNTTATLTPGNAAYPTIPTGTTSAPQIFSWTNTSLVPLSVLAVNVAGDYAVTGNTCLGQVAAGASCSVAVFFSPTTSGVRPGTLTIQSTSSANPTLVANLSGTGVNNIVASPTPLTFGNVDVGGTSPLMRVTVANFSQHAIALTGITINGDFAYTSNCPVSLPGPASCQLALTFNPTTLGGRTGVLSIATNDPGSPLLAVQLAGNGVDFAVAIAPPSNDVIAGRQSQFTMAVTPLSGYSNNVALSCAVPSPTIGSQCFLNTNDPLVSAPTAVLVTATTTAQYTVIGYGGAGGGRAGWLTLAGVLSASLLLLARRSKSGVTQRKKALDGIWLLAALLVLSFTTLACSGRLPDRNVSPTLPGTYTYTVGATDGFLTHTATFKLNVTVR